MEQVVQNQGLTILMKFGKEKNLKSLQSGLMYMKNLAYYVGQEKKDSDDVIGDQYDGVMLMQDMQINIKDIMKDVYPVVAQEFGKSLNSAAANIERLTRKCWEKMVAENTVALYWGKPITDRPATKQMLCCLATLSRTGNTYFSDSVDSERAEAEKIVEKLLADGMSANELLEKLKSIQRGGKLSEPET